MKPRHSSRLLQLPAVVALVCAGAALVQPAARAGSDTWTGGTDGNWSTWSNWSLGTGAPGATNGTTNTNTATFNISVVSYGTAGSPIVIDLNRNLKNISFDTSVGSFFIGTTDGNPLLLTAAGSIGLLSAATGTNLTETINAPLKLHGNYTFNNARADLGSKLVFGGDITNAAASTLTLRSASTNGGAGNLISGIISDGAGVQSLAISAGTGMWTLSGANTFTGNTTLTSGTLNLGSAQTDTTGPLGGGTGGLPKGTVSFGGGTLQYSANNQTDYSSKFTPSGTNAYKINTNSQNVTFASALPDSSSTGLTKSGEGTLTLANTNTYTGPTLINIGELTLDSSGALSASSSVTIAKGATFDVSAKGTYELGSGASLTASGTGTTVWAGIPNVANASAIKGGTTVALGSRPITLNLAAGLAPGNTTHPALYIPQGALSLGGNQFTVNAPAVLADGTYRIIQVGNGTSGTITDGGAYPNAAGTAVAGKSGTISVGSGNVILTVASATHNYADWALTYGLSETADQYHNNNGVPNGVAYFMGVSPNVYTANPVPASNRKITWPKSPLFSGTYTVQTSPDLQPNHWTNVSSPVVGGNLEYTLPTGQGTIFARLLVTPN
ncbi:MAG: autotransporter-associated beta strand repeat-containing protein [Verrucomicrobia bacterium]|nr:autotransporter-associated beta strand repeat-containing protein [Verrucomicrobiota bacterium]